MVRDDLARWQANPGDERERLHTIILNLDGTLIGRYQLRKNPLLQPDGDTLIIRADPGPFEGHDKELVAIVERYTRVRTRARLPRPLLCELG